MCLRFYFYLQIVMLLLKNGLQVFMRKSASVYA